MTSDNHSCETQACPARVNEKGSEWGTWPVSTIHCPVRRCHQRSGSVAGRAVIASKPNNRIAANAICGLRILSRIRRMVGRDYTGCGKVSCAPQYYRSGFYETAKACSEKIRQLSQRCTAPPHHAKPGGPGAAPPKCNIHFFRRLYRMHALLSHLLPGRMTRTECR